MADGTVAVYYYHRDTGMRLEGFPGSPEFLASIKRAEDSIRDRGAGTFNSLIREFTASTEFRKLAESTRREYIRVLTKAESEFGDMPLSLLNDPRVRKDFLDWREAIAASSGPREADNRLSVISSMLTWARGKYLIEANHLSGFQRIYSADRSDKIWMPEHIDAFMSSAPIEMQRALILALHTGQRQGDLLRLSWNNFDGEFITLRQGKTSRKGKISKPVHVKATTTLLKMLRELPRQSAVILTTKTGRPWRKRYFALQWEKVAIAAGIKDLHFHDLRGTTVTLLAESGCEVPEIAAITGHSLKTAHAILERYLSRTRGLAVSAMLKFQNAKATDFANRLQTGGPVNLKEGAK